MKKTKALLAILLAVLFCFTLTFAACDCEHEFVDGKCTKCGADDPNYTPPSPPSPSKAVITVNPTSMTVTPDDEVVLLFGVSATLDGQEVEVIVSDDGGFDPDNMEEGVYTITYKAGTGESQVTATRTITVEAPKSRLALEVRQNKLGESKWQGNLLTFKNALYVELTQDTDLPTQSGVFCNKGTSAIKLNVEGAYGCSAILDKNGVVIEGRDGANSKLVNAANPTRAGSSVTTIKVGEEDVAVNNAFAKELVIPAGGYAVVVQAKYASDAGADFDGRGFMNYNVIGEIGNVVRLYWVDSGVTDGLLTPYVNQAPYVVTNNSIYALLDDKEFNLQDAVKEGIVLKDDNGTFQIDDDVTIEGDKISIADDGGFDIAVEGVYSVTLTVTDGTVSASVVRKVEVKNDYVILTIDDKLLRVAPEKYIYNQEVTASSAAKYGMIVLDKSYEGEFATNGYGAAIVLDKFGALVRIYDGANLGLYDKDGKAATTPFTTANYAAYAWENLGEDETLIVCPNNGGSNETRGFLLSLRPNVSKGYFGVICSLTGFTFEQKTHVITVGEGQDAPTFTAVEEKYSYNKVVTNPAAYKMIVLTKKVGDVDLSGYKFGNALIVDKYGKIKAVYSGSAKAGIYTADGKAYPDGYSGNVYAVEAYKALANDDLLIIFPNDGTNGADSARTFVDNLIGSDNAASVIGKVISLTDVAFADPDAPQPTVLTLTVGTNKITVDLQQVALNPSAAGKQLLVFTTEYSGVPFASNNGVAFVISGGKIVRIYDGISQKYFDAEHAAGQEGVLNRDNYLTVAIASLKANEYLLAAPNTTGSLSTDPVRSFFNSNRTLNADVSIEGYEITPVNKDMKSLKVNGAIFFNSAIATNVEVTKAGDYDFVVYSYGFSGIVLKNGWSEIFVVDASTGKVVKIYDGVNGKYYDAENTAGVVRTDDMFTLADMSLQAFDNLQPNQLMVIGLNGGRNSNAGRTFLLNNRVYDSEAALVGAEFPSPSAEKVTYMTITVGSKIWRQDMSKVAIDDEYTGVPAFAIYNYGYEGVKISNGYGEAFIVDSATGKIIKIFDGANGKYYDSENPAGVQNGTCTAAGYVNEAFAALEEGQYVIIATNGGSEGNVARGFFMGSRTIGADVSYTVPQTTPDQGESNPEA